VALYEGPEISISISNAWFLLQACTMLMNNFMS